MSDPNYREAYPGVDLVKARKAIDTGFPVCGFFEAGEEEPIGEAFIPGWSDGKLFLASCFVGPLHLRGHSVVRIQTEQANKKNVSGMFREYFLCPNCEFRTTILYLKFEWACGHCHELSYRSKLIPEGVRRQERVQVLRNLIGTGRPKRMRQSTFRQYQKELNYLVKLRGRRFGVASVAHMPVITARWETLEDVGALAHPGYHIVDGQIVPRKPFVDANEGTS